jgi:hypothetical protein
VAEIIATPLTVGNSPLGQYPIAPAVRGTRPTAKTVNSANNTGNHAGTALIEGAPACSRLRHGKPFQLLLYRFVTRSMDFNPPAFTGLPVDVEFLVMLLLDQLISAAIQIVNKRFYRRLVCRRLNYLDLVPEDGGSRS